MSILIIFYVLFKFIIDIILMLIVLCYKVVYMISILDFEEILGRLKEFVVEIGDLMLG